MGGQISEAYVAADVDACWEKVKRMCLYSTDSASTQRKHARYSLQLFVELVIVLRFLLVKENMTMVRNKN